MNEGNVSDPGSRLASIRLQELRTDSITGVITNQTEQEFQLEKTSFLCVVNKTSTSHEFQLQLELETVIPQAATNNPLFNEVDLVVRCPNRTDVSILGKRHEAGHHHLVYIETSKFQYCRAI